MNQIIRNYINELSKSPTELTDKNIRKIYEYLPVPNDYKILWADINSFGGFPSGIVFTDRGIVTKAPKQDKEKKNEKVYKIPYQIVPWEYFDPGDYIVEKNNNCYTIKKDNTIVTVFSDSSVTEFFEKYDRKLRADEDIFNNLIENAVIAEVENFNFESAVFNAAYGKDQTKTGHGIYAEEAGTILDKLSGEKSSVVGRDNAKNGPDKLVDGKPVQCKFCKSANSSIGACFKKNPNTDQSEYRYFDIKSGKPMQVEVPSDQYNQAVEAMKKKIENGQVPGVSNPEDAEKLVRKSKLTYEQAKNLAKAGTFESITYDLATGTINCTFGAGISALTSLGLTYWQTKDLRKAGDAAIDTAINVFGPALAANILTNQIARTGLTKSMIPLSNKVVEKLGTKTVQKLVNARRVLLGQKKIYGAAASKSLAKALRSNAVTEGISFVVFSIPDTYMLASNKISGAQFTKNMLSSIATITGNVAGVYASGIAVGKIGEKIGKKINKRIGAAIGFTIGTVSGMVTGGTVKKIIDTLKEDDCVITARLFNAIMLNMIVDYYMSEEEIDKLVTSLDADTKKINKFQRGMRASEHQYNDIYDFLTPYFEEIVASREFISVDIEKDVFSYDRLAESSMEV